MATNDFLPMATGANALVDTQANYAGSGYQVNGFQPGVTLPAQFNKGFRQGTTAMAILGDLIIQEIGQSVSDDGDTVTLLSQLTAAIRSLATGASSPKVVQAAFAATSTLDCSQAALAVPSFELTLTGNTTLAVTNQQPGQLVVLDLIQDATGGRVVTWPANIHGAGDPVPTAGKSSTYIFRVGSSGDLYIASGPASF